MFKSLLTSVAALLVSGGVALAQSGAFPNYPIVGGAAYSCGSVNGVSNCTVSAGPTVTTGNENIPANTNLSGGRTPQNVLLSLASLNALPISVITVTSSNPANISASNISGGVIYNSTAAITAANITLPLAPIDGQQYRISANNTITTLAVSAGAGSSLAATTPTVMTASATVPQGYTFRYDLTSTKWFRIQ